MTRYQLYIFLICSEIIYVCSGSSNSTTKTWYLFMDCITYLKQICYKTVPDEILLLELQQHFNGISVYSLSKLQFNLLTMQM